jgi:dienelactone hydrolase
MLQPAELAKWLLVSAAVLTAPILASVAFAADDPKLLQAWLNRQIVGKTSPGAEAQRYCATGVPPMSKIRSAAEWEAEAARLRSAVLEKIIYRGEGTRWRDAQTKIQWLQTIEGGPGYKIKKLRFEALPGMWIPALLYEPEKLSGRVPAVLNVNGHTALGKQYPPKQIRCINQAKRGMLALNIEWPGMGQLRTDGFAHGRMNQLDLCGTSGMAPFYLAMKRGLDVLLSLEHTDPQRVAMTGLSGGGWQTIVLSSLDTRVKLANPVAGYSGFGTRAAHLKDLGDSEQAPNDLATLVDYTHLTAMMAPRPLLLTYNAKDDCCFESGYALQPLVDAAAPIYGLYDRKPALRTHVNHDPGTHNYERENREASYRMLRDFFYAGSKDFDATEIPSGNEIKSEQALQCELPAENEDFHTLAMKLAKVLPRDPDLPMNKAAAAKWQRDARVRLQDIVRMKDYTVTAVRSDGAKEGELQATFWKLQMNGAWTVPALELARGEPTETALLVADGGRASAAEHAARLLKAGYRVLALDPFDKGECKLTGAQSRLPLQVATLGGRPLGLQVSQVAAAARWAATRQNNRAITMVAVGPVSSTFALVAAGLEEKAIGQVELYEMLGSLKEVIEQNWQVEQYPEMFCFGLLEAFDIKHLGALVAPRSIRLVSPSSRAKAELSGLRTWCDLLDGKFEIAGEGGTK